MTLAHTPLALLPPLVALLLALRTRRVLPSLGAGGLVGAWMLSLDARGMAGLGGGPVDFVGMGVLGRVSEAANAQVLVLIALIGGFVHLLEASGAARALVSAFGRFVTTGRRAEGAAWLGGLALFFSDTGNVLILGPVFRPVFDKLGLARERLAWIVDATAAPVSVLVPFITWGVYITGLLDGAFPGDQGLSLFVAAIPHNLYALLSVLFVGAMAAFGHHWGPMRAHDAVALDDTAEAPLLPPHVGWGPLLTLLAVLGLFVGALWSSEGVLRGPSVRLALGCAYVSAIGSLVFLLRGRGREPWGLVGDGIARSTRLMMLLILAWALGFVCRELGTGEVVATLLGPWVPTGLLPLALFATGAIVSFASGTSWGTFAILMPIAASLATEPWMAPVLVGAVLSGGVFGDHTSPISDTTLLASVASGVEHAEHVRTQLPYALVVGAASAVGFVVVGSGLGAAGLGLGVLLVAAVVGASRLRP